MANWITLTDMSGQPRTINADLVFTVHRDVNKTVLSTTGETVFLTPETVADVMKLITGNA